MKVEQVYNLVNQATNEVLGTTDLLQEDLSNVVDVGTAIFNANAVDNYVKSLVNLVGKQVFVNRIYRGGVPSVMMDGWEFGSILQKIETGLPEATENQSWELNDGQSYPTDIFRRPSVSFKNFNDKVTFDIPTSFTTRQVKESLKGPTELNAFLSMLETAVENSMTVRMESLIMKTIANLIAETVYDEFPTAQYSTNSGMRAVNLLKLYNSKFNKNLTAEEAYTDPEFIRFTSYTMSVYMDRMSKMSTLFNIGRRQRFTPRDRLHVVMLSDFKSAAGSYLQSDTFNKEYTALPNAETVPYWQGSGEDYSFGNISEINVVSSEGHAVEISGILAIMFDHEALGVTNLDRHVNSRFNEAADFYNNWYKFEAGYFNDFNENFVVFFVE